MEQIFQIFNNSDLPLACVIVCLLIFIMIVVSAASSEQGRKKNVRKNPLNEEKK